MRKHLNRSIAFLAGVLITASIFEIALRWFSPYGWGSFHVRDQLGSLILVAVWVLPGALLGFSRMRETRISLVQSAFLGALYWAVMSATVDDFGRLGLGLAAGVAYLVSGPVVVSWLGGLAVGRKHAHG